MSVLQFMKLVLFAKLIIANSSIFVKVSYKKAIYIMKRIVDISNLCETFIINIFRSKVSVLSKRKYALYISK